jgi:16S rRNA (guanine527-N7)-methyltransferase
MPPMPCRGPDDFQTQFGVSRETIERLELYAALLAEWGATRDLVAPSTMPDVWHRHFADSAQLAAHLGDARRLVDLGTGAGFPGMVIAILQFERPERERIHIALVEATQKKIAFLAEVAERCGVTVELIPERIEIPATHRTVGRVDIVTARALAPLGKLLGLSKVLFAPSTRGLFLKGRNAAAEVSAAAERWRFSHRLIPSLTDPDASIVEIRQLGTSERG